MWEDEHCKDGGQWAMKIPKTHSNKYWEDLCLLLIGDQFTEENEVNGIVIQAKPNFDSLQIWNKSGKRQSCIDTLRDDIVLKLNLEDTIKIDYQNFAEAIAKYANPPASTQAPPQRAEQEGAGFQKGEFNNSRGGRGRGRGNF